MVYTFAQLKATVLHKLGGEPDARISAGLIVNRALAYLQGYHAWTWLQSMESLSLVAGQDHVDLPADFGRLIELQPDPTGLLLRQATPRELMIAGAGEGGPLHWMLGTAAVTGPTVVPARILLLAPAPAANQDGALTVLYERRLPAFPSLDSDLTADTHVAEIPEEFQDALYHLCRAFAGTMEVATEDPDWKLAIALLDQAKAIDTPDPAAITREAAPGTFRWLKDAVRQKLQPGSRLSASLIVNRALAYLKNYWSWSWLEATASLNLAAGQSSLPLPADFGSLVELVGNQQLLIRQSDARGLMLARSANAPALLSLHWMLGTAAQSDPTAPAKSVLLLAPTPTANLTDALSLYYRRELAGFPNVDGDTSSDANVPAIPASLFQTLATLCRAMAGSWEANPLDPEWQMAEAELRRAVVADQRAHPEPIGRMRGTLGHRHDLADRMDMALYAGPMDLEGLP